MAGRFLAIARPAGPHGRQWIDHLVLSLPSKGLKSVFKHEHLLVFASDDLPFTDLAPGGGVVLGAVFRRGHAGSTPVDAPIRLAEASPLSAIQPLINDYWGGYVACLVDGVAGGCQVLRDPSGAMPCYRSTLQGVAFFYSDIDLPWVLGLLDPELDTDYLAHHLAYPDLKPASTGLTRVREVLAGTVVSVDLGGGLVSREAWSPWAFTAAALQIEDRDQAVDRVRTETRACVAAWASRSQAVLIELSGGLDSSIVASCVQGQAPGIVCVTVVTPDPGADERRYAQAVADHIGAGLEAAMLAVDRVDLTRAPQALSPRPGPGLLAQAVDQVLIEQAMRLEADAFFSGGGGDNVFCYLNTAAPAADALLTHGLGAVFARTISDLAALHRCTLWKATVLALKKAWRRPAPWRQERLFLAPAAVPSSPYDHPWLDAPPDALPGKRDHVAALMRIQNVVEGKGRMGWAPVRYPLLSQPMMELCLRIPSWMWVAGGRNRSVARDAFVGSLPPEVLNRRTKGDFRGFCGAVYARDRSTIEDLLLGGWLAGAGLVDTQAIEAYLKAPGPPRDDGFHRLLDLVTVEVWARAWLQRPILAVER